MKFKSHLLQFSIFAICLIFSMISWSRAGGAGGGHGGGGGGGHSSGGGGYSHSSGYSGGGYRYGGSSYGNQTNSDGATFFIIVIFIIICFSAIYINHKKKSAKATNLFRSPNSGGLDPEFSKKVEVAFLTIQQSWSQKRLDPMRRFITDGVYQRFNAQFTMMNLLDQTDVIQNVQILAINLVNKRTDGIYDVIDVSVRAYAEDQFVSLKYPLLDSPGGGEQFTEFWSFIRRKDYKKGSDIFHSDLCPKCAAPISGKLIQSAQCPFCSTYLNNGEYDWVLAEITQEVDFAPATKAPLSNEVALRLPGFSQQLVEDRASNAFMQILIASALKNEAPLVRFSSKQGLEKIHQMMNDMNYLFDRLFLNAVEVTDFTIQENWCFASVDIRYSFRRVQLHGTSAQLLEDEIITNTKKLVLARVLGGASPKGSIYANSCSHCGAPQKDSLSSTCSFCNQPLNDPKTEWVVHEIADT